MSKRLVVFAFVFASLASMSNVGSAGPIRVTQKDGHVAPFDGDMDDYRDLLLKERGGVRREKPKEAKPKPSKQERAAKRAEAADLQKQVRVAEARIAKIEDMKAKIDELLADPDLYVSQPKHKFEELQKKRKEIVQGLEKAEALWLEAQERLEAAG